MMKSLADDPFFRAIQGEVADTLWQVTESEFLQGREDVDVDLGDARKAEFWTLELGVNERELRRAIDVVGPKVSALLPYLRRAE